MYIYLMNEARTHSIGNNFRIRLSRLFSEDEQSAILFVGDIDDTDCEILVDFIKSYTTTIFPVSYDDIIINYQLDSCKGEKGSVYKKSAPCNGLGKDMQGLLPPANEVWGKVMFLYLCVILFTVGGGLPNPPGCRPPGLGRPHQGGANSHPPPIRSTSGRYASYWNAYLF